MMSFPQSSPLSIMWLWRSPLSGQGRIFLTYWVCIQCYSIWVNGWKSTATMNDLCILVCELLSIITLSKWQFCHSSLSFHVLACETNFCALCLVGSVLSQYGVHSFPVIFVHNKTSRVRYHGSRTLEDFVYFYQNYTGKQSRNAHFGFCGSDIVISMSWQQFCLDSPGLHALMLDNHTTFL
jgi:hypothetical protein